MRAALALGVLLLGCSSSAMPASCRRVEATARAADWPELAVENVVRYCLEEVG